MTKRTRLTALTLGGTLGMLLLLPGTAFASRTGRRNTAIALGAVAAYGVVKKNPAIAGVAGAGAIYSYVKSQQGDRHPRRRRYARRVYCPPARCERSEWRGREWHHDRGHHFGHYKHGHEHHGRDCD